MAVVRNVVILSYLGHDEVVFLKVMPLLAVFLLSLMEFGFQKELGLGIETRGSCASYAAKRCETKTW
ncbi:hypothetical protein PanWU01x14_071230, partial [Parasponia andersonii]